MTMRPPMGPESEHPASCIRSLNSVCTLALLIFFMLARGAADAETSPESLFAGIRASNIVQVRRALNGGTSARAMDRDGHAQAHSDKIGSGFSSRRGAISGWRLRKRT